jgi:hypothetical protein
MPEEQHKCYHLEKKRDRRKEIISDPVETNISEDTGTGDVIQVFPYNLKTKCRKSPLEDTRIFKLKINA